jgi:hypothetical protein
MVVAILSGVILALLAYSASGDDPNAPVGADSHAAAGNDWPPILDPDPEVMPPKWDWQLAVPVQVNADSSIKIYDIDFFQNENSGAVDTLHGLGNHVICYLDVGSWEDWRDDAGDFPQSILGEGYDGFPDERWLDIRDVDPAQSQTGEALAAILRARFDRALNMGCDAIEPDNMDVYDETAHDPSGFPLTYEDQIYFNLWVAQEVHQRGMLVGLKNDINQAHDPDIYNTFDFVVSEECVQYDECDFFSDFLALNKPVFLAEYSLALNAFCPEAKASRLSAIKKRPALNTIREDCSAYYTVPVADSQEVVTPVNQAAMITLSGSDPGGDPLTFTLVDGPSHGSLTGTAPDLTYDPNLDYSGPDSFTFTVTDGTEVSAPATVSISVCQSWDVNCSGNIDILDIVQVGNHWGETGAPGWIREDVNGEGVINILDVILIGNHWGQ